MSNPILADFRKEIGKPAGKPVTIAEYLDWLDDTAWEFILYIDGATEAHRAHARRVLLKLAALS